MEEKRREGTQGAALSGNCCTQALPALRLLRYRQFAALSSSIRQRIGFTFSLRDASRIRPETCATRFFRCFYRHEVSAS